MLYWIYEWWKAAFDAEGHQHGWAHTFSFFNLFQYITFRAACAALLSFLFCLAFGPSIIRRLISLKIGQPIRQQSEVGTLAILHGEKAGVPTMGGVMILGAVLTSVLVCARPLNPFVAVCTFTMLSCGLLGFMDDYKKVTEKKSDGVSARTKLFWQLVIALVAASFFYFKKEISGFGASAEELKSGLAGFRLGDHSIGIGAICFPLKKKEIIDLGWLIIPFFATVIIGCSNAVNLTDGLDGLASGCTITVALAYAALAYVAGHYFMAVDYLVIPHNRYVGELAIFLMAMAGACFGFLWFNCNPAVVFMGDTGSLAIGGAIGAAAIAVKQELMLVIIGGVFVMEALSVMIQVTNFKIRKRLNLPDKRIFLMTPIHHHFEMAMMGLSRNGPAQDVTREQKRAAHNKIAIRFWILSIMLALFGLALLKVA